MAIYEVTITTLPLLLATLALGPLRLFGLLPHRTARRDRRVDRVTDRSALQFIALTFVLAVVSLALDLEQLAFRLAVATELCVTGILVVAGVWRFVETTYADGPSDADSSSQAAPSALA